MLTNGAGIASSFGYNPRLQPTTISVTAPGGTRLSLSYNFNLGSADNGNVMGITNTLNGNRSQTFTYDALNRIASASTPPWSQTFSIDIWGNLYHIDGTGVPGLNVSANPQNRLEGFGYDAAGNMTNDGLYNYAYDAENRMTAAAGVSYSYDGDGRRVKKEGSKLYWYGTSGEVLLETDLSGSSPTEYVFFNGKRVARRDSSGAVYYYFADYLGSSRVITDANGTVCYDADFYPFQGERSPYVNTCTPAYKFAGMRFDPESGNYNTLYRYYPPNLGRWLSPDPLAGSILNPQSLNRYAYVVNKPTNFIDPLGLQQCPPGTTRSGPGQCEGPASSGLFPYPNGGVGASGGPTICAVDGIETDCSEVANNLHGSSTALIEAIVRQGILYSTVTKSYRFMEREVDLADPETGLYFWSSQWWVSYTAMDRSWCASATCMGLLQTAGNFASGAADVLTIGGTYLVQRAQGTNSVVNRNGGAYYAGVATGAGMQAAFAATAAALANGKNGALFGRGLSTLFNSWYIRFGWYWAGPAIGGKDVIGLRIGAPRTGIHIPFLYP